MMKTNTQKSLVQFILASFSLFVLAGCTSGAATPMLMTDGATQQVAPNILAVNANATVQALNVQSTAAQMQVDLLNQQSTATSAAATAIAFAPFAGATQAAMDIQIQQMYSAATSTSAAATQTAAMMQQAYNAQATTTAGVATQIAAVTQQAFTVQVNNDQLALERAQSMNELKARLPYLAVVILFLIVAGRAYVWIKKAAVIPNPVDERGKAVPMIEVIEGTSWDIERATNGMIGITQKFLHSLPTITAERQDQVTARAQLVDMQTRITRVPKRLLESLEQQEKAPLQLPASTDLSSRFLLPDWDIINGWDGKNGLPYYTAQGLEIIDTERVPHLSTIGATGSGKSRRFFRPLITCALAAGHRVIIIGKSTDYVQFESHPNATLLKVSKITEPGQAQRYAQILEAIVQEMNRRDDVLTAAHQSTWTRAGHYRTFIFLDELGNALRLMDRETSAHCRILVEGLVSEGRKVGFNMMLANQRATGMVSIFSQTGKAVFRVEPDEERAHKSLAGASTLPDGYFLAKFGASKLAGGFEPTDAQIAAFLAQRQAQPLEPDEWIDAVAEPVAPTLPMKDSARLSAPVSAPAAADVPAGPSPVVDIMVNGGLSDDELKVIELYQAGGISIESIAESVYHDVQAIGKVVETIRQWRVAKFGVDVVTRHVLEHMIKTDKVNLSQAQREIYGETDPRGGKHFEAIQKAYAELRQNATATATQPEKGSNTSNFGGIGGSSSNIATGSMAAD